MIPSRSDESFAECFCTRKWKSAIAALPIALVLAASAAAAQTIPWDRSQIISRTSSGEDIKTVLRSLLQSGGFNVVFAPEVSGTVTFRLDRVPVHAAFDQLVEENGLTYTYNEPTRTVT